MTSAQTNLRNNEFATHVRLFKENLSRLNDGDKSLASKWANRLREFSGHPDELALRNRIMFCLLTQMQMGVLVAPFDSPPRFTRLDQVQPIPEMNAQNIFPENFRLPKHAAQSPDQGAFLVSQPVPKCGAYCYLAVVSRPPADQLL